MSERDVEIPWAVSHAVAPCLDVGNAESTYLNDLPSPVTGIDVRHPQVSGMDEQIIGDIRTIVLEPTYLTVLAISTLEHIGMAHKAYTTVADDPDGDRHGLEGCVRACHPDGKVLVSVPFGSAGNHGWYRSYDEARLRHLLDGFRWEAEYHRNPKWAGGGVALVTVTP